MSARDVEAQLRAEMEHERTMVHAARLLGPKIFCASLHVKKSNATAENACTALGAASSIAASDAGSTAKIRDTKAATR